MAADKIQAARGEPYLAEGGMDFSFKFTRRHRWVYQRTHPFPSGAGRWELEAFIVVGNKRGALNNKCGKKKLV